MQIVKITDPKITEFNGIRDMVQVVADPVTGKLYRKTLVKVVTLNADGTVSIAADSILRDIIILPGQDIILKIGSVAGGDDILLETVVEAQSGLLLSMSKYYKNALQLYFTGIAPGTVIKLVTF